MHRCDWTKNDEKMNHYHDTEWGVPVHDDLKHFEFLVLDAFQAGLSWKSVLYKRESFREAFDGFNPEIVAEYTDADFDRLMQTEGIIRNKLKIKNTISNARQFLRIQKLYGSFDHYIWQFTHGKTIVNSWEDIKKVPAFTQQSDEMSYDLKKEGFKFVGTTICYAYMQAAGMVNDHVVNCFRYREINNMK